MARWALVLDVARAAKSERSGGLSPPFRPGPVDGSVSAFVRSIDVGVRSSKGPAYDPGSGRLRYPDAMRVANREGEVLAQFIVDKRGVVDMTTFKALKATEPAFTEAVRTALPTMRFEPAQVKGRAVKQLMQQPFTFALAGS